jgi:hypothetical protein
MNRKLPWLLAALPLLGAVYAGCGSHNSNNGFISPSDSGYNTSSGQSTSSGTTSGNTPGSTSGSTGSSGTSGDDSTTGFDSPTSNSGGD